MSSESSGDQPKKKKPPRGRPFAKGVSGNPGGRPGLSEDVKQAARAHTMEALETLANVMRGGVKDADRLRAAEVLLNRAWGTPTSSVEMSGPGGEQLVIRIVKPGET